MKQNTLIRLPVPLHGRLKALAAARNTTMVQVIADMVDQAVDAGEVPDKTPGFDIEVTRLGVTLHAGDELVAVMTVQQAHDVADTLEEVANSPKTTGVVLEDGVLTIRRRGTGVSIEPEVFNQHERYVLAPEVARDLARQIHKAAQQSSNQ